MAKRVLVYLVFVGSAVTGLLAGGPGAEMRTHYVIAQAHTRLPMYYATAITQSDDQHGSEVYLFEDTSGKRIRVDVRRDYKAHTVTAEYRLNGGRPVKVRLDLPGTASGRRDMLKEYKEHPELKGRDVPVTLESHGQTLRTGEKEWKSARADTRTRARDIAGPDFVAALTPLRTVLGFPQFGGACSTFGYVSDGATCLGDASLMIAATKPDCDFDAGFGLPCDGAQKQRALQQPKTGRVGAY